jgi:hypothetical protein
MVKKCAHKIKLKYIVLKFLSVRLITAKDLYQICSGHHPDGVDFDFDNRPT